MNDYDERTQRWLIQTQALRRAPATRGGNPPPDPRVRRHTVSSVAVVALLLLALLAVAPRVRTSPPPAPTRVPIPVERVAAQPAPAPAPARGDAPAGPVFASSFWGMEEPPSSGWLLPPGQVPPPAPIWLDGASRAADSPDRVGVFLPSGSVPRPPFNVLGR